MSSPTHVPVAIAGVVVSSREISCSVVPVLKSPSGPKSTSLILNAAGTAVGSGVHTSMWKCVMAVASICSETNSIPANTRFVYSFVGLPSISISATSASSKSADQVSTVTSV